VTTSHAVSVLYAGRMLTLNRAVGMLRRRNFAVRSLAVVPAGDGCSLLTVLLQGEEASVADRLVLLFRGVSGVRDVAAYPVSAGEARELALVRLHPAREAYAELLDTLQLYGAEVVTESAESITCQVSGSETFVQGCIRALERFGVTGVARSGTVALPEAGGRMESSSHPVEERRS
jgi:acetolactate synthase I/III small subunit